ncbi:MAG: AmpG family muropeptide MFS transporter [Woeseia sp.]|nr:AmpG family muropeptide MFS transporter [Woeseia sp.]
MQKKVLTLFFLGFSAGLPFPLVYSTLTAWLEEAGLERSTISTFAWLGFAYSFKFLWSPLVDTLPLPLLTRLLGRRRAWLFAAQIGIGISLFLLGDMDPARALGAFTGVAIAVALLSATQDIALDAYRIEIAKIEMQGVLAAAYQYGYRIAIAVGTAGALYIAEFGSWSIAYKSMAACMAVGVLTTLLSHEPAVSARATLHFTGNIVERVGRWLTTAVAGPFMDFFDRYGRHAVLLLAFIGLFRISDYVLGILANPFYLNIGFSKAQIASVAKIYGLWVSLAGTAAGAWAILRFGLSRCVVTATVLIASTNLFFAALAITGANLAMLTVTISADNFTMGFAGTVFIAYLSSLTNLSFTATQYALLSSMSTVFGKFTAGYSGNVQEAVGWLGFFLYAAALGIPAILLSVFVARHLDELNARKE